MLQPLPYNLVPGMVVRALCFNLLPIDLAADLVPELQCHTHLFTTDVKNIAAFT